MQSIISFAAAQFARTAALLCLAVLATPVSAQWVAGQPHKPTPVKIDKQIMIFPESVVLEQWPHTPKFANPPQNLKLLNPGQCIRVGVIATGDDRDDYLGKTQLSFRAELGGQAQDHPMALLAAIKEMKPEGEDMINAALTYAGIPNPGIATASLGPPPHGAFPTTRKTEPQP